MARWLMCATVMKKKEESALYAHKQKLDILIVSAQGLHNPKSTKQLKSYCVVYVDPKQKAKTRIDKEGDTDPTWNEKLSLCVEEQRLQDKSACVVLEIYRKSSSGLRDKMIGKANVPLTEAKPYGSSVLQWTTVEVQRPGCFAPMGILNVILQKPALDCN